MFELFESIWIILIHILLRIFLEAFPVEINAELVVALLSLAVNGLLTAAIFWVNTQLKEIEAENHRPQLEVNRYRFYAKEAKGDSFEVELSNFGSGAVDNLRGVAQAFPDNSEEFGSEPVDIALERTNAVESGWNAVRARGMAGHEENIGFICEAGLRFTALDEDSGVNIYHFQQAVSNLADKAENIRFKYKLRYDCKFNDSDKNSEEVLDIIFPAREEWDLQKALDEGWEYQDYLEDEDGYRAATV